VLAREGCRRQVLSRRAGSDGEGSLVAQPSERLRDRRRQSLTDCELFKRSPDLTADRAYRLAVVWVQARQPVQLIPDRRQVRQGSLKGVRRHAESGRHADAFDPRQLPQERAFAADDRNLALVDLLEIQYVTHSPTSHGVEPVNSTPVR
jgi:hypothetical protein